MLFWPLYSPDLPPIEHVRDMIGHHLKTLPLPRSEEDLWQIVQRERKAIPRDHIHTLIDPVTRSVSSCIAVWDYCLLQFDALNVFLLVCFLGGSPPNFNIF